MSDYLTRSKEAWKRAGGFPLVKTAIYPDHATAQEFSLHTGKQVLEYGCGGGADAYEYLLRGNNVTLCDIVSENLEVAKKRLSDLGLDVNAKFVHLENSTPLPVESEFFDLVNSHGVLHHIVDPVPVILEFYRILKLGGLCYIMLYTEYFWERFLPTVNELVKKGISQNEAFGWCTDGEGTPYSRFYTEEEGYQFLQSVGFVVERTFVYNENLFRTFKGRKV